MSFFNHRTRRLYHSHKGLFFALIAVILFFVVAEVAVRAINLVGRPPKNSEGISPQPESSLIADPELFWRYKPNSEQDDGPLIYRINSLCLRDKEIAVPKPSGVFRILSLGESTTFGAGVELNQTYTKVSEKLLREGLPGMNIEVVNAGVGAYTSFQCVAWLSRYGLNLEPDMVWLFSGANDGLVSYIRNYANVKHGFGYTDKELHRIRTRYAGLLGLLNRSDLYKLLKDFQTETLVENYRRHVAEREGRKAQARQWRPRVPPEDREENLLAYVNIARENQITPIFLLPAYWNSPAESRDAMRIVAAHTKTRIIDLPAALHSTGQFDRCWYSLEENGGHPNALGHRLMGEAIAKELAPVLADKQSKNL